MEVAYKEDIATRGNKDEQFYLEMSKLNSKLMTATLAGSLVLYVPAQASTPFVQDSVKPKIEMTSIFGAATVLSSDVLSLPRLKKEFSTRMHSIAGLHDNWDGYGASSISAIIVRNARTFLRTLQRNGVEIKDPTNIYPTPYGTVVIEVYNDRGLVSMEIDRHRIGFFTDYRYSGNWGAEGIDTDFKEIPEQLKQHLS